MLRPRKRYIQAGCGRFPFFSHHGISVLALDVMITWTGWPEEVLSRQPAFWIPVICVMWCLELAISHSSMHHYSRDENVMFSYDV